MPTPRFIQIHALQNYTGVLLNRDDSGLAKTMPYGGVLRTRISSQCLKRHWRKAEGEYALSAIEPDPVRTKELVDLAIMSKVREKSQDLNEETAKATITELNSGLYGEKGNDPKSRQPLLFGQPEIEYLAGKVTGIIAANPEPDGAAKAVRTLFDKKNEGNNFQAFRQSAAMPAGLIGAMFGRMMTSDNSANIDAAVHVAHAFTVSGEEKEIDYFTAMEELSADPGAAHIGDAEINSGIYYVYVCIDVSALTSNTTGCSPEQWLESERTVAAETASRLAGLVATVSPGAKKGSTAPYGYARALLVEAGERQPRSLAGAYRAPAKPDFNNAIEQLKLELENHDDLYGTHEARQMAVMGDNQGTTLAQIIQWTRDAILKGEAR